MPEALRVCPVACRSGRSLRARADKARRLAAGRPQRVAWRASASVLARVGVALVDWAQLSGAILRVWEHCHGATRLELAAQIFSGGRIRHVLSAAVGASPSAAAEATLLCRGADAVLPATAARAFAASLVPLAAASVALSTPPSDANAIAQGELPPRARRLLAASLTATTAVQLAALAQDGHALRPWARRLLFMPLATVAASAAA